MKTIPPRTSKDRDVEARSSITTSALVVVSQNLLLWSGWDDEGSIGAADSVDFYTRGPQTLMLALTTGQKGFAPTAASWDLGILDSNGHELNGGGYARVNVTFAVGNFLPSGPNSVQNGIAITWPTATAVWSPGSYLGIYSHSDGALLQSAALSPIVTPASGDTVSIPANNLTIQIQI
jgi:hypothetical protein